MSLEEISKAIIDLRYDVTCSLVKEAIAQRVDPMRILIELRKGMEEIGQRYETGELFLADLIMAGEIMKGATDLLRPHLTGQADLPGHRVVLGTIEGDLHDIGKDIVATILTSSGFDVRDLGIDVPPKRFVEEAQKTKARLVGISALLSTTVPRCRDVVTELEKRALRKKVKVIAGGAAVREEHTLAFGVDGAVNDAMKGLEIMKKWTV